MGKPKWGKETNAGPFEEDKPKRFGSPPNCFAGKILVVADADDLETFLKNAAKIWRKYHPIKRGRPFENDTLVFQECIYLCEKGSISETWALEKLSYAVMESLQDRRRMNRRNTVPYFATVQRHVRVWRKTARALGNNPNRIAVMSKELLDKKIGRPHDPWGPWYPARKKKKS